MPQYNAKSMFLYLLVTVVESEIIYFLKKADIQDCQKKRTRNILRNTPLKFTLLLFLLLIHNLE